MPYCVVAQRRQRFLLQYKVLHELRQFVSSLDDTSAAMAATPDRIDDSKSLFSSMKLIQARMLLACSHACTDRFVISGIMRLAETFQR